MFDNTTLCIFASAAILLSACGDENTYVTQGDNKPSVSVLESGKKLYKQPCDSTNIGSQLYVKDSSSMYFCDGEDWISMKGTDGKDGDDGTSCTAKKIEKDNRTGYILTCGKDVVDTLWDGKNGQDGKDGVGKDGSSCTTEAIKDGYKVICGGDSVGVVKNGEKGEKGEDFTAITGTKGYFKDFRNENDYSTLVYGTQTWLYEELEFIPAENDSVKSYDLCSENVKFKDEDDDYEYAFCGEKYKHVYFYTWEAAKISCPEGWHLPDSTEWAIPLENEIWPVEYHLFQYMYRNSSEMFEFVNRVPIPVFRWTSMESGSDSAYAAYFGYFPEGKYFGFTKLHKQDAVPVNCIKDSD